MRQSLRRNDIAACVNFIGDHGEVQQLMRPEAVDQRHIARVTAKTHRNAANARHIVARVEIPPPPRQIDLNRGREIARRIGRIPVGYGFDAGDVALISSFGQHQLINFTVITDEIDAEGNIIPPIPGPAH